MKCSTRECPSEVTEDCWAPPHLLQSFVACEWVSHSFSPYTWHLFSTLPSGTVPADFNQKGGVISVRMQGNMSLVADGGFLTSQALSSPTSLPLNANHLASCKTQKYAASSV
jgi:hypothetical protein